MAANNELAHAIYRAWQTDERWLRDDLATASKHCPLAFFWAEIAASAALAAEQVRGSEWQPIKTAPASGEFEAENKQGDRFLVWRRDVAFIGFPIHGGYLCVPDLIRWRPATPGK